MEECVGDYKFSVFLKTGQIQCVGKCETAYDDRHSTCVQDTSLCSFVSYDATGKVHCLEACPEKALPTAISTQMECVSFCPPSAPFSRAGICTKTCLWLTELSSLSCVTISECTQMGKFMLNDYCVSDCPDGYGLLDNRACFISDCRFGMLIGESQHIACYSDSCPGMLKADPSGRCVDVCEEDFVVIDGQC